MNCSLGLFSPSVMSSNYNHQCIQTLQGELNLSITHHGSGTIMSPELHEIQSSQDTLDSKQAKIIFRRNTEKHVVP